MDKYLEDKFKGKYRVMCHYDTETMDFVRTETGELDQSIADFYIKCQNHIEIKHGKGKELYVYCPAKQRGVNILRQIYQDKISEKLPNDDDNRYSERLCAELEAKNVLFDISVLDFEVMFGFFIDMMDYMATLVKPVTSGASINALSTKNLKRPKVEISKEAIHKYDLVKKGLELKHYKELNNDFITYLIKNKQIKNKDFQNSKLKFKEYIYSLNLWDEYVKYIEQWKGKHNICDL